jgi:hypothetical protein
LLKPIRFQKLEPKFSNISAPPTTNQLLDGSIGAQTSEGDAEDVLTQREGTRRFASVSDVSDGAGTVQDPLGSIARSMASCCYI